MDPDGNDKIEAIRTIVSEGAEPEKEDRPKVNLESQVPCTSSHGEGGQNEKDKKDSTISQNCKEESPKETACQDNPKPHVESHQQQQQLQMMNVDRHMQSMNLVAHYEAQMRDHLAAFTHAAAGAAWAAAQVASMSTSGNPVSDSQIEIANAGSNAAATAAAAAAAAASSAVSQLQQQSISSTVPYVHHDPTMLPVSGPIPMDPMNNNNSYIPSLYSPPPPHTMPMHMHAPPQPYPLGSPWQPPEQNQYNQMQHLQYVMPNQVIQPASIHAQHHPNQPRQRNRGRYDQNTHNQNQPNKRHQKMQGKNNNEKSSHDATISMQMQQMQFQSPPNLQHLNHDPLDTQHNQNYNPSMDATVALTNKRPYSSSSSLQGSLLEDNSMSIETEPNYINAHSQPPIDPQQHPNETIHSTYNRSARRLWSPNSKIENKRTMHKKYAYSSSPSNSDTKQTLKYKKNHRDSSNHQSDVPTVQNINNSKPNNAKPNRNLRKTNNNNNNNKTANRRRLHSSLDSGNSSGGGSHSSSRSNRKSKMNKKRSTNQQTSSNSQRPYNLIGKTGVMALHELCSKRHWTPPKFIEITQPTKVSKKDPKKINESSKNGSPSQPSHSPLASTFPTNAFFMSVHVHDRELGRGRGGTKTAARQDAARQALTVLIPNIAFDHNGILIYVGDMSDGSANNTSSKAHEESIRSPQNSEDSFSLSSRRNRPNIYPCVSSGMSSTSEDDNSYYASRGASVCSTLLHAMWQIDHRIQEPPSYNFEVCSPPILLTSPTSCSSMSSIESSQKTKRNNLPHVSSTHVPVHRSSFACTASIILSGLKKSVDPPNNQEHILSPQELLEQNLSNITHLNSLEAHKEKILDDDDSNEREDKKLEAIGTGATKREARHVASAKLLALLFPACNGMVEVMAAAEAARENYAASKALTKQHKRALNQLNNNHLKRKDYLNRINVDPSSHRNELSFALPKKGDPTLPPHISNRLLSLSQMKISTGFHSIVTQKGNEGDSNQNDNFISVAKLTISESKEEESLKPAKKYKGDLQHSNNTTHKMINVSNDHDEKAAPFIDIESSTKRQVLRQRQLEVETDDALQKLFELDDEGRSSFGGNSIDEVGRIILRRACVYDYEAVTNLLTSSSQIRKRRSVPEYSLTVPIDPLSQLNFSQSVVENLNEKSISNLPSVLWGGSSIILVLSRAVASHDEPPLGCAVLTLQFALQKGRVLKICDIAHEVHLPRERFLECLEEFASNMKCVLVFPKSMNEALEKYERDHDTSTQLSRDQLEKICMEYCSETEEKDQAAKIKLNNNNMDLIKQRGGNILKSFTRSISSLQAVEEEDSDEVEDEGKKDEKDKNAKNNANGSQHKPSKRSRVS